jgi:TRAP-type C4-dicarboxylate transport system substrate-binding protein
MEGITSLREEVKIMVDKADEKTIRMMYAMLEAGAEEDWWDSMPDEIKTQVEEAIQQADRGEGISYEEVKKRYAKWFVK